jgi:predicted RNase H-like HicB family nuclease
VRGLVNLPSTEKIIEKMKNQPNGIRFEEAEKVLDAKGDKMNLNEYMKLPYNIIIRHVQDASGEYYFATVLELDGCMSDGATFDEAYVNIKEAMEGWIETKLQHGYPVPEPADDEDYSGKFVLRLPKSLHKKLAIEAKQEGVSLNQYALYRLSN